MTAHAPPGHPSDPCTIQDKTWAHVMSLQQKLPSGGELMSFMASPAPHLPELRGLKTKPSLGGWGSRCVQFPPGCHTHVGP